MFDLIIVGAGPAGINCGIEAHKAGLNYCILEKGVLVNSIYHFPTNMTFFSTSKKLEIGEIPFISHTDKPTRKEALEYYRRLVEYYQLEIKFKTEVVNLSPIHGGFRVDTKTKSLESKNIVIATGFYDNVRSLNIKGENLPKVKHYYDDAHPYIGMDIAVVGGANSACDVALETWSNGANVTMVVRQPQLYQKVKYWILPNIENRIKEGSIKAFFNSSITEIRENEIDVITSEGKVTLANDYVLAMTGYKPSYKLLDQLEVEYSKDENKVPIINESTLETNVNGVYVSGVINGGLKTSSLFIENTRDHGAKIVGAIIRNNE